MPLASQIAAFTNWQCLKNELMDWPDFFTNLGKLKLHLKMLCLGMVKSACSSSNCRILLLAVSTEGVDELARFFACKCKCGYAERWFNGF